jgi:NADH dehydrogenase FAD-containing subunit
MAEKKNIVIVGGGYAGVNLVPKIEKFLPASHRIVLIEEQDFFYHKIGALRAAAAENIADKVLVPYDKFFKSDTTGIVVKASVTEINPHSVTLSQPHQLFGEQVPFEYLVGTHCLQSDSRLLQRVAVGMILLSSIQSPGQKPLRSWPRSVPRSLRQKTSSSSAREQ